MNWLIVTAGIASVSILGASGLQPGQQPERQSRPGQPTRPADPARIVRPGQEHPLERSPEWSQAEVNRPGKHHELLQPIIGDWTALVTIYREGREHESRGVLHNEWVLGKRFVRGTYTGDQEDGEAHEGISYLGYNNAADRYEATWLDTNSTEILRADGHLEPSSKVLTLHGEYTCTMTGAEIPTRIVARMETEDRIIWQMFEKPPEQREHMTMQIVYTRRDAAGQDLEREPVRPQQMPR